MADTEEVPENRPPRSKKFKKTRKFKSMKMLCGGCHSAKKGFYVHRSHVDCLKSFGPRLEEVIGLLKSERKGENLSTILINQKQRNIELGDCIALIGMSIGMNGEPILPLDEEDEEALLEQLVVTTEHPVFADTSAESESRGGIESGLKVLIKNLEEQMACITDLIRFLELDGSTNGEMVRVIRRLYDLSENAEIFRFSCELKSR